MCSTKLSRPLEPDAAVGACLNWNADGERPLAGTWTDGPPSRPITTEENNPCPNHMQS
jgi:hypothetical protein